MLSAFDEAIDLGLIEAVEYLIGKEPQTLLDSRDSAVYTCAKNRKFEIAKLLAEFGFPINVSSK